jgi:excisionase family DNA binding protein
MDIDERVRPTARPGDAARVLLTPERAADVLSISRWKLYELLRTGRLRSVRIGTCRRIPTQALDEFIADLTTGQPNWHA